jgi:hypothetical protein
MVLPLANTRCSVLRGTTVSPYGDTVDAASVHEANIPALLVEKSQVVHDPATQEPRTIRTAECYVPPWLDVLNTDQVYDQLTGNTYMIIDIVAQPAFAPGGPRLTELQLRRVTAATT